jgi:hypothetical protein
MVKRKLIGMGVCSVLLIGNCMAGISSGEFQARLPEIDDLRSQLTRINQKIWAQTEKADLNEKLSIMERLVGLFPIRRPGDMSRDDWEDIRDERSALSQDIVNLRMQINTGSQGREEPNRQDVYQPFTSIDDVKRYINRIDRNDPTVMEDLTGRVDATIRYILTDNGEIFTPSAVPHEEWRKAKVLEILYEIENNFPKTRIARRCRENIQNRCLSEVTEAGQRDFEEVKLLLLAQCRTWDEVSNRYEVSPRADREVVKNNIHILRMQAREGNPGAQRLIEVFRTQEDFSVFFSSGRNS